MSTSPTRLVLFVCVENTFRKIIAEAIFNAYAPTGWMSESAGVEPAESMNPVAVQLLHEIGLTVDPERKPRLLTPELVARASRIVTFGCLDRHPIGVREKSEDWHIPGSMGSNGALRDRAELLAIRGEIERRVLKLTHDLQKQLNRMTHE